MLGKIEGKRRKRWQRMRWLERVLWIWANCGREWRTEEPDMPMSMGLWSQTWLSNWETTISISFLNEIDYRFQVSHQEIPLQCLCCYWQILCSWGIAIPSTHVGLSIHSFIKWYLVKTMIVCIEGAAGYKDYALGVDGISWDHSCSASLSSVVSFKAQL